MIRSKLPRQMSAASASSWPPSTVLTGSIVAVKGPSLTHSGQSDDHRSRVAPNAARVR